MKIKYRIIIFFVAIIVITLVLGFFSTIYFKDNYSKIKYNKAYEYYYTNDVTIDEYAEYLINSGFIVTQGEIDSYATSRYVCHLETNEIIIYDNGKPRLYAYINEFVVNDFLKILDYVIIIEIFFIISILIVIYTTYNKYVINRLLKLEKAVKDYDLKSEFSIENRFALDDEISALEESFITMIENIEEYDKQKKYLVMALSHELKNPITKIDAILEMYLQNFEGYTEKELIIELIKEENEYMIENLNKLLTFYKNENDYLKRKVDILSIIKKEFDDDSFVHKEISINYIGKSVEIETYFERFKLIINNIKSNVLMYTNKNGLVEISINENKIVIINTYEKIVNRKSSKVGNVINDYLAKEIGMVINHSHNDGKYITVISFENKIQK